jgi:hypothetical protein
MKIVIKLSVSNKNPREFYGNLNFSLCAIDFSSKLSGIDDRSGAVRIVPCCWWCGVGEK